MIQNKISSLFKQLDSSELWVFAVLWCTGVIGILRGFVMSISGSYLIGDLFQYMIYIVPIFLAFRRFLLPKIKSSDVALTVSILFVFFLHLTVYPDNGKYMKEIFPVFIVSLPYIFFGICIDIEKYKTHIFWFSLFVVLIKIMYYLLYLGSVTNAEDADSEAYNMSSSYQCLPAVIYTLWYSIKEKSIWKMVFAVLGVFFLSTMGTRGPLVCTVFFLTLYAIRYVSGSISKLFIVLTAGSLVMYYSNDILEFLFEKTESLGMSTRIYNQLLGIDEINSTGRDNLLSKLDSVMQSDFPILGEGICGTYKYIGNYAHNLYYDLIFSFGYILGILILSIILITLGRVYFMEKEENAHSFFLILVTVGFFKLFISNVYLCEPYFFMLIGYCIQRFRVNKAKI